MKKNKNLKAKKGKTFKKSIVLILLLVFTYIISVKVFPRDYKDLVEIYSKEYNINTSLIYAVISTESSFRKNAESDAGAKGLMQITGDTGVFIAKKLEINDYFEDDLFDPDLNIKMGTYYLKYLEELFDDKDKILSAYNAGPNRVKIWVSEGIFENELPIPYGETRRYVKKVKLREKIYNTLYLFDKD